MWGPSAVKVRLKTILGSHVCKVRGFSSACQFWADKVFFFLSFSWFCNFYIKVWSAEALKNFRWKEASNSAFGSCPGPADVHTRYNLGPDSRSEFNPTPGVHETARVQPEYACLHSADIVCGGTDGGPQPEGQCSREMQERKLWESFIYGAGIPGEHNGAVWGGLQDLTKGLRLRPEQWCCKSKPDGLMFSFMFNAMVETCVWATVLSKPFLSL